MAGPRPERNLLAIIWRNFRESLTMARSRPGIMVGKDYLGTSYYEIPAEPRRGKRRPSRWFETATEKKEKFDQDIPAEWEAWLRGRRDNPPTEEEVNVNFAMAQSKKVKAAELHAKELNSSAARPIGEPSDKTKAAYPTHEEYETIPGKPAAKP